MSTARFDAHRFAGRLENLLIGKYPVGERRRWMGPGVAAFVSAAVIWLAMPHVHWYFKAPLAAFAFAYVGAQSAAYLARDESEPDENAD